MKWLRSIRFLFFYFVCPPGDPGGLRRVYTTRFLGISVVKEFCAKWRNVRLWRMEPDRRFSFFFSPHAHLCAVTYITDTSLHVTLRNQSSSFQFLSSYKLISVYIMFCFYMNHRKKNQRTDTVPVRHWHQFHGGHSWSPDNERWDQVAGGISVYWLTIRTCH